MDVTITLNGLDKMVKLAEKYPAAVEKYVNSAISKSLGTVDINVFPIVPIKTRGLYSQLHNYQTLRFEGYMRADLPYAVRVHNMYQPGTPYRNPSLNKNAVAGFLTMAVHQSEDSINRLFETAVSDTLKEIAK